MFYLVKEGVMNFSLAHLIFLFSLSGSEIPSLPRLPPLLALGLKMFTCLKICGFSEILVEPPLSSSGDTCVKQSSDPCPTLSCTRTSNRPSKPSCKNTQK